MNGTFNSEVLSSMITNRGRSIASISMAQPLMIVFLRHFGCTFCREAMADIALKKAQIESTGTAIVLVHMSDYKLAEKYFTRYNLKDVEHISDKECYFYQEFGLTKGNFNQLFGLKNWIRGFNAGLVKGYFVGLQMGDGFQMPGVFVIYQHEIKEGFIHKSAADRPDYLSMLDCCRLPA